MRILYVTNGFPYPLTSGYLRHYHFIRELSERHSITLVSLVKDDFRDSHIGALEAYTERVIVFRRTAMAGGLLQRSLVNSRIAAQLSSGVRSLWNAVEELTRSARFDAALFTGKFTLPEARHLGGVPAVADICDAGSARLWGRIQLAGWLELPLLMAKYLAMRRLERRVLRQAAHSVCVSPRDRDALTRLSDRNVTIVPNGVDLNYWTRSTPRQGVESLIFSGAMNYGPNVDAAMVLMQEIFPRVVQAIPQAQLQIVGREPLPCLQRQAALQSGVTVTGYVDDMRPYLENAALFVAPLRFAAGIQNKVLEAMAMEMHVIASPAAAGGLRTEAGHLPPIAIADQSAAFAEAIVARLQDTSANLNPQAREFVQRHFGWRQAAEKLEQVLMQAAGHRRATEETESEIVEQCLNPASP